MDTNRWLLVAVFLAIGIGLALFAGWRLREDHLQARHEALVLCQERRAAAHPEWTLEQCHLICLNRVWVGMTPEQARASWGNPSSIDKVVTETGESQQWEYGGLGWLRFENGLLANYDE